MSETDHSEQPTPPRRPEARSDIRQWQRKLLPLMALVLVATAAFACYEIFQETQHVREHITRENSADLKFLDGIESDKFSVAAQWRLLVTLENQAMANRYRHIGGILLTRLYVLNAAFVTGLVLCLTGAAFVLGKLQEEESRFEGEANGARWVVQSSSPGLIMVLLGTILIIASIFARADTQNQDAAVYLPFTKSPEEITGGMKKLLEGKGEAKK